MSASGRAWATLVLGAWEWMTTTEQLDRETVLRWALSVRGSRRLVITRRVNRDLAGYAVIENIVVKASVFDDENMALTSKSWKTKTLASDLEAIFEGKVSFEMPLIV